MSTSQHNPLDDRIFFRDSHCALVYKKIGENAQRFFLPFFEDEDYAQSVNRLDTPVCGLQLIALSKDVHTRLTKAFQEQLVTKEYYAICERRSEQTLNDGDTGTCQDMLIFNTKKAQARVVPADYRGKAKKARLEWRVLGRGERYDFLSLTPKTGRTHQIRVQLAHSGHPIKGDLKYGAKRSEKTGGIRLCAVALGFQHPITSETISRRCTPMPNDALWQACMTAAQGAH